MKRSTKAPIDLDGMTLTELKRQVRKEARRASKLSGELREAQNQLREGQALRAKLEEQVHQLKMQVMDLQEKINIRDGYSENPW